MLEEAVDPQGYALERTLHRVVGHTLLTAALLPAVARRLHAALPGLARADDAAVRLVARVWFPTDARRAAAIGAFGGALEDYHCRLAYDEALREQRNREPPLWTPRTLGPGLLFFLHPCLALRCLDGELKGSNCALARIAGLRVAAWPHFAVLPEPPLSTLGSLERRLGAGFFPVERRAGNDAWRVF